MVSTNSKTWREKQKKNLQTYKHTRKAPELAWGLMFTPSL